MEDFTRTRELMRAIGYLDGEFFSRTRELMRAIGYLDGEYCAGSGTVESNCIAIEPCEVLCVPLEVYEAHFKI
ncbi:hypothetical protein [Heyndrickxia oleronia]|uniref:hypothetical protein n=1 Tax=Heyndrickxia oleronia TaxID=38875 RepID=UPI001F339EE7